MKKFFVLSLFILSAAISGAAYTRITQLDGSTARSPKWVSMPISYSINARGLSQIANGSEFNAVQASFQTWQDVAAADIRFDYRGTTQVRGVGRDGINLVSFADDSTALGSSTLAATYSFLCLPCSDYPIQEADIIVNDDYSWTTSGESGKYDIQAVLTHEIGHLLGLDHSALVSSVMVPFASPTQIDQRTLQYDDIAGVVEMYPKTGANQAVGQIRGLVSASSVPVFGAHVVAVDANGTPVVSTLSLNDGSYTLRFVPAGNYRVYAEPLDLPVTEQYLSPVGYYRSLKTDFGTTYSGNVSTLDQAATVLVTPGGVTSETNIEVAPKSSTSLNLTRPTFAVRLSRGISSTLTFAGVDLSAGTSFSSSSAEVSLGSPTYGTSGSSTSPTSAAFLFSLGASTPLGPKNVAVNRGLDAAVVSGAIVVVDPQPASIAVLPASGPANGQTRVTITGNNFRTDAKVYFGGLPAPDVRFVNSNALDALTPMNAPGSVNVQVINSDGTSGVATRAFNYLTVPPTISHVSPLSGPPSTSVLIEGAEFDSRTQNLDVRFNGISARVVNATATTIQTIVPYGATSGPISVSVFGQGVTGPQFTVTAAPVSSNVATPIYKFIDALPASGGSNVTFTSNDDAVALLDLPFTFSLFGDAFLSGERIAVATNGWVSLDPGSTAEFQNGPLPGQSVIKPSGVTGIIPAALISPFFDDLIMVPGVSSVSTRLTGSAPNRQFVVQWSRMSILDESGRDLNASLTFELVLFEGSNDIQFAYASVSGQRSDGSSATIGAQDLRRQTAIQTGFNQALLRNNFLVTYKFNNGQYTESAATVDSTPPSRPVVVDSGAVTNSTSELTAWWTSDDAESGIREYQYAIGTSPGATDVRGFTTTAQSSDFVTGLTLQNGATYYFAVRAVNNSGLTSEVGVSDGIRIDPAFVAQKKYIPFAPQDSFQFTGIALLAPSTMTVTLRAIDASGNLVSGSGARNPVTVGLAAGQQYARLVSELFGVSTFGGWIEVEASAAGLGVFVGTGAWDMSELDGTVPRELSADFVATHAGAGVILANPSPRPAVVTMSEYGAPVSSNITIPARGTAHLTVSAASRFRSTEPLAAVEHLESGGRLAIVAVEAVSDARDSFVFPHAVIGAGYFSWLTLTNTGSAAVDATLSFGSASRSLRVEMSSSRQISLADFLGLSEAQLFGGALRVTTGATLFGSAKLIASLDIMNSLGSVFLGARPASTDISFPHVANGNGLFTGLAIAAGASGANVTIEIYPASGGTPRTTTLTLSPNQQIAKLLTELVSGVSTQVGGYIRIRSDQPIWTLEMYVSDRVMAVVPPI